MSEVDADRLSLSVVIPAHNEDGGIRSTVQGVAEELDRVSIDFVGYHLSRNVRGFGFAVRAGLDVYEGDAVAIVMADGSDDPADLVLSRRG